MPGFMGMRGLDPKSPHDMERERRMGNRDAHKGEMERRSEEKVHEILRDQDGDMSAYNGGLNETSRIDNDGMAGMPVGKIMSARVAVLSFDDTLLTVQGIFSKVRFRHLPVVNAEGEILGIISDRDHLRLVSPFFGTVNEQNRDKEIMARRVGTVMTRKPICATPDTTIIKAVELMNSRKISCLPIVENDGKKLLGIVTWKDIVRAYCPGAFTPSSESSRLRSGVKINPETRESARVRQKAAESARLRAVGAPPPPPAPNHDRKGHDTSHIVRHGPTPKIAATEKLPSGNTAGQAGSDLAAIQKARMREHLQHGEGSTADSARLRPRHDKP